MLRKKAGWSQDDWAEKINVSRQAISRWKNGTALPDAQNVLQLSKMYHVTTDYLLNDNYESDGDIPVVQEVRQETKDLISRKKMQHLLAAICFTITTICSIAGIIYSTGSTQLVLSCLSSALCAANAVAQYILYARKSNG